MGRGGCPFGLNPDKATNLYVALSQHISVPARQNLFFDSPDGGTRR